MIRLVVILVWLLSACASMPEMRKADSAALLDTLGAEVDRVADRVPEGRVVIETACFVASEPPECADARAALAVAEDAVSRARAALAEARANHARFYFAADKVESAVSAVADLVSALRSLR